MQLDQLGIIKLGRSHMKPRPGSCPSGYNIYKSHPGYGAGYSGTMRLPEWSCAPAPVAPIAPPPAPVINVTSRVSPTTQTQISPQISPVFSQLQDSPYARTSGAPSSVQAAPQVANQNRELERIKLESTIRSAERRERRNAEMQDRINEMQIRKERRADEERGYQRQREQRNIDERERQDAQVAETAKLFAAREEDYGEVVQSAYQIPSAPSIPQNVTIPSSPIFAPSFKREEYSDEFNIPPEPALDSVTPVLLIAGAGILFLMFQKGNVL